MKNIALKPYIVDERYKIKGKLLSEINPISTLYEGYDKENFEKVTIKLIDQSYIFNNISREERKKLKDRN